MATNENIDVWENLLAQYKEALKNVDALSKQAKELLVQSQEIEKMLRTVRDRQG